MTAWERKGYRAGLKSPSDDGNAVFERQKGKPKMYTPGVWGDKNVNGKYVEAKEYFLQGFYNAKHERRSNSGRRRVANGKDIYYVLQHGGSKTHYHSLASAKRAGQTWANKTGLAIPIYKASHKQYHRTGQAYVSTVATMEPKLTNSGFLKKLKQGIRGRVKVVGRGRSRRLEIYT